MEQSRDEDGRRGVLVRIRDRSIAGASPGMREESKQASKQASTGKEARQASRQAGRQLGRQAVWLAGWLGFEKLTITVGRGCFYQDEAGRRSLPTPLFPLLALFLPPRAYEEGLVPSIPRSTLPFFSLVLTDRNLHVGGEIQPPSPAPPLCKQRSPAINIGGVGVGVDVGGDGRVTKIYSFRDMSVRSA
ncbi:hypothetical protein EAI_06174 [Harpegnathos saltator]|uniref:Uncharacterized protein n=1 Tax=Harpegnathos saltator TaxID=610380 RepID=E2C9I8_HARSA|nr:hypothetical protein EAI_06174 [Harpegnathos saltator]